MRGVQVGEEQANGDACLVVSILLQPLRDGIANHVQFLLGEGNQNLTFVGDALAHAKAVAPLDQGRRLGPPQGVMVAPIHPLDERYVLKAPGGEEKDMGPLPL